MVGEIVLTTPLGLFAYGWDDFGDVDVTKAPLQGAQAKLPKRACSGLTFFDFERRNVEFF